MNQRKPQPSKVVPPQQKGTEAKGILYCVAYMVLKNGTWEARTEYTHGHTIGDVRNTFLRALPSGFWIGKNVSITAIGPVVGYFIDDEKRMILNVD